MPENDDLKNLPAKVSGINDVERVYPNSLERSGRMPMVYGGAGEDQGAKSEFSLRDILYVLFRHKWKIVIATLLLAAGTVFYIASIPQLYESEARVLIRGDRTGVTVDPTGEGNSFMKASRDGGSVRTEIGIMMSQMLAERVVDKLGAETVLGVGELAAAPKPAPAKESKLNALLDQAVGGIKAGVHWSEAKLHLLKPKLTPRQMAVQSIVAGLEVAPTMSESYVLRVAYRAPTPETARQVLDALVDAYQQQHIQIHKAVAPEFFEGKIVDLKKELNEKENALDAERKRLNISSLETEKANLLNKESMYETALRENVMRISSLKAKVGQLEQLSSKRLSTSKGVGRKALPLRTSNPLVEQLRARLIEMKLRESDMADRFTDKNPELIDVRAQIKSLERQIVEALKSPGDGSGIDPIADADPTRAEIELQAALAKVELDGEAAREGMLMKELDTVQKDKSVLMANEKDLKRMEREVEILDQEYKRYLTSMQTADISATLDKDKISNVSIVQRATLPTEPAKSQRKLLALLGFGLFMSLIAGVGWAFGLEYCDHSIKNNEDVERQLGLPVLVAIPYNKHHKALLQEENS